MEEITKLIRPHPLPSASAPAPTPTHVIDSTEAMRAALVEAVLPDLKEILAGQVELAKGVWVKDFMKDKKTGEYKLDSDGRPLTKVYFKLPDKDVAQYLLNQVIGKPKENTVIEGKVNFILDV